MATISTPCRQVCRVDPLTRLCTGCGRTLAEIANWGSLDEPTRRAIMGELWARLGDGEPKPGDGPATVRRSVA